MRWIVVVGASACVDPNLATGPHPTAPSGGSWGPSGGYLEQMGGQLGEESTGSSTGRGGGAWVFSGRAVLAGEPALAWVPCGLRCGNDVVGPGDVDGDGVPDLGVAGGGDGPLLLDLFSGAHLDAPAFATVSWQGYDTVVTALGDLDGDGLGDLGFDPGFQPTWGDEPWGWVVPGSALVGEVDATVVGWALVGEVGYVPERPPYPAGDFDGDGIPDVAVVGSNFDGARVRVVPGSALGASVGLDQVNVDIPSPAAYGGGDKALGVGDVDGDGRDDLMVAPSPWSRPGDWAAAMYLVSGAAPPASLSGAVRIDGGPEASHEGSIQLARVGDLDGDGRAEVVAELSVLATNEHHRLVVVPGAAVPSSGALSTDPYVLSEAEIRVVVPCDLDGDGLPELVTEAGIWAGTDLLQPGAAPVASTPSGFGYACVGDVDGDGAEDLAVTELSSYGSTT